MTLAIPDAYSDYADRVELELANRGIWANLFSAAPPRRARTGAPCFGGLDDAFSLDCPPEDFASRLAGER